MRPGKIILSASALPVPAECLCYRQGPCCWLHSHAKVAAHLVAQVEGISLSNLDGNKSTRDLLAPGARAKKLTICLARGQMQRRWTHLGLGVPILGASPALCPPSVFAQGLWQGALWLGSAPEPSPSPCGTAWATDMAALPRDSNHPCGLVCCISPPHKAHCR